MTLERNIENPVVNYAKKRRVMTVKLNWLGRAGWPDRIFIGHRGIRFIEFKRPGGHLTELQLHTHREFHARGVPVYVVDNVEQGRSIIDQIAAELL